MADITKATTIGKYRIGDLISDKGGFGWVYQAIHPDLNEVCAIKILRPERVSTEELLQLRKEGQKMAQLRKHKNILQELDAGLAHLLDADGNPVGDEEHFYILMELMDGSLADWVGKLDPREARLVFKEAAEGVQHIHSCGYVHQDIKPANILVRYSEGTQKIREVKLSDFGLASSLSAEGSSLLLQGSGTLPYMAPEVLSEQPATPASDIYSLGVTFYEALTGQRPTQADRSLKPSALRKGIPRGLDRMILAMLHPEAAQTPAASPPGTALRPE